MRLADRENVEKKEVVEKGKDGEIARCKKEEWKKRFREKGRIKVWNNIHG